MRVLAATIGALLISVSYPALAQEHDGGPPQCEQPRQEPEARGLTLNQPAEQPSEIPQTVPDERQQNELEAFLAKLPERSLADLQREAEPALPRVPERSVVLQDGMPQEEMPQEEMRQPEAMKAEMELDPAPAAMSEMPADPKWAALAEESLGTRVDIPRAVFSMPDGNAHKGTGRRYKTPDGRAKVAVWTQPNTRRDTPANYLRRTFVIPRTIVDYERFTPEFAAVSGEYRGKVFYIRCNLSLRGRLHCFDLAYPVREKKAWDPVVTRMSRSLRPY
jgi:hypothetical protein